MKDKIVYVASPFFNDVQRTGLKKIEEAIESVGFKLFSPSRDGIVCPPNGTKEQRLAAFKINIEKISESCAVVAWVDWLNPSGCQTRVIREVDSKINIPLPKELLELVAVGAQVKKQVDDARKGKKSVILPQHMQRPEDLKIPNSIDMRLGSTQHIDEYVTPPLNLPDIGTVFEMGIAHTQNIPIFSLSMVGGPLNLMLAEAVVSHSCSIDELKIAIGKFLPVALEPATEEYVRVVSELKMSGSFGGEII